MHLEGVFVSRLSVAALLLSLGVAASPLVDQQRRCSDACRCSTDATAARCEALDRLPEELPTSLRNLVLTAHSLRTVTNTTFANLPQLEFIDLSEGRISEVLVGAFSALPRLRSLSLRDNELTYLPADAFADCAALQALDLSGNPLVLPSVGPFLRSDSLRELSLSMVGLSRVTEDAFGQLPGLRSLNLTDNSLAGLPADSLMSLTKLSWLGVDEGALSNGSLDYLTSRGVVIEIRAEEAEDYMSDYSLSSPDCTSDPFNNCSYNIGIPEEDYVMDYRSIENNETAIYLGFLDWDYKNEVEDADSRATAVEAKESDSQIREQQPAKDNNEQTGAPAEGSGWRRFRWPRGLPWRYMAYAALLGALTCATAALSYYATLLAIRRHRGRRAAQKPRDTLDRAFRSLPAYRQLQAPGSKAHAQAAGYARLVDEEDGGWLPPRADRLPAPCTCLSCSEPVPTQPCIRHYSGDLPAGVHGPVPGRYYTLYTQ